MRARLLQALPVLVVLVAVPLALAVARDGDAPVRATGADVAGVTDDDGGVPMFQLAALAPGRSLSRCIRVRYAGDGAGAVRLDGRIDGAALAARIALVVERGTGGDFDGCAGFRGVAVFRGTLAELADAGASAWRAEDGDAATYRFTATAAPDLPERDDRAAATFTWHASVLPGAGDGPGGDEPGGGGDGPGGGPPAVAGGPGGQPGAPGAPAPAVDGPAAGGDGGGGRRDPGAGRDRDGRRGAGDRARAGDRPGGTAAADGPGGPGGARDARGGLARAVEALARAAVDVGERAAFPVVLLLLIGLFLSAQHRIDQRDPKLALAPVHREVDVPFTPLRLGGPRE
ncbi:MAG TPA: hypothetical protein VGW75_13605 [Solirubrobacteraceae bacterium]|jgi:hypothetical protein|nr:hypothetical protein [Solirubrobacteraceae bacterium]